MRYGLALFLVALAAAAPAEGNALCRIELNAFGEVNGDLPAAEESTDLTK